MSAAEVLPAPFLGARATGIRQSDRPRWLAARHRGLGGSEVAAILGVHPYKSALEVYADKIGAMPPEREPPEVARWGSIFEEPILHEYARRTRRLVVPSNELYERRDRSWHLVTPDGVQFDAEVSDGIEPGLTEVKTTGYGDWSEAIPSYVLIQVQHGLMVTAARWATLVWLPFPERRLQWRDIAPHAEFQAFLTEKVDQFWTRVVNRTPPDADGSDSARAALFALEPELADESVELLGAAEVANEVERIDLELDFLERRKKLINARVLQTLGPYKVGLLDDGRYWNSWRTEPREQRCGSCSTVHGVTAGFRAVRLMQPRKKPHALPREQRAISLDTDPDLVRLLEASLARKGANDR